MRSDPFRELDRLSQQLFGSQGRPSMIPIDAYRRGDSFVVHFDLPGVDPDKVDLTVERNSLTIRAERAWNQEEGDQIVVQERPQGVFTRQLLLGEGLDTERIEASYDAGVLTIRLPVASHAKPRRVPVTSTDGRQSIDASSRPS